MTTMSSAVAMSPRFTLSSTWASVVASRTSRVSLSVLRPCVTHSLSDTSRMSFVSRIAPDAPFTFWRTEAMKCAVSAWLLGRERHELRALPLELGLVELRHGARLDAFVAP